MPRPRTIPDADVLDAALVLVRSNGPDRLTFAALAARAGLAGSTIVQRFGTRTALVRATLLRAWDLLDDETADAIGRAAAGPRGVIDMLVQLSGQYDARDFADQLLILREDVRDPILRARGEAWIATLIVAIEDRLRDAPAGAEGLGALIVAQWQGTLTVWSFTPRHSVADTVAAALDDLLDRLGVHRTIEHDRTVTVTDGATDTTSQQGSRGPVEPSATGATRASRSRASRTNLRRDSR